LVGLDLMWGLGLTQSELQELAAMLGSDIPFCIGGGTAIATGRGERLSPIPDLDHIHVVLAKHRNLGVSTPWAYQTYRQQYSSSYVSDPQSLKQRSARVHSGGLVNAIAHKDAAKIGQSLHNDLEKVVLPKYPQVQQLRDEFEKAGVLGTMMSGSGPSVFALTETRTQAELVQQQVATAINDPDVDFFLAQFNPTGIKVI
jgi:4-diphosphocytidyl-2-C-methyl-D-erythritol kinase